MRPISPSNMANSGRASFSMAPSDHVHALMLKDGQPAKTVIPEGAAHVAFSGTVDIYVLFGMDTVVAVVPSVNDTDGTAPELNPAMRFIPQDHTHISIVSPDDGVVTLSFYGV